jgi:TRAP-type mannitol/chloroaromatic compound transport system substrate-binding protein
MNYLSKLCHLIDALNERIGQAVSWVTLGLVVVVFADVVMRYLFNTSFVFTQELEWHLFAFIFLIGAGGTVVLTAGGEIFTNLERGVIDAIEWVGPYHDLRLGLYQAAKYYYYPGWHEPGTCLEVMFNKKAYDALPSDLKVIIDAVAAETNMWSLSEFEANNGAALEELIKFPDNVLDALRPLAAEVLEEEAAKDPMSKKVHEAFKKFKKVVGTWGTISEKAYYDIIVEKYSLKG